MAGRFTFSIPPLPKPEYQALKKLCALLEATQLEVICVGIRLAAGAARHGADPKPGSYSLTTLKAMLGDFRASAPSETAPLL